ncbi:hypothetical protein BH18ACT12_BH18ACT12_13030 [soil metagenome]
MNKLLLDYTIASPSVANPDGSFKATFTGASAVAGPGTTSLGPLPSALDLGSAAKARVDLKGLKPALDRFCIRVVFRAEGSVTSRQNLAESNLVPFALYLDASEGSGDFDLVGAVAPKAYGWRGSDTRFKQGLKQGTWYTADLVYDTDTAGLFVDGVCVSVYAFPNGTITKGAGKKLSLGAAMSGSSRHFDGSLAAFQWHEGIPPELEALLDEQRTRAEWFITYKRESVRDRLELGERTGRIKHDWAAGGSYIQPYEFGAIMCRENVGAAFELHGAIHHLYISSRALHLDLGYLVSDEGNTTRRGGRKSLFSKGGIYWSPATGAVAVTNEIYLEYEHFGESKAIGFPVKLARAVAGGEEQEFEGARMYHKKGAPKAFAVQGAILARFLATGGVGAWGYPVTNELDVWNKGGTNVVGKSSEFEACTFYWSPQTGAHEVHGDLRQRYRDLGGPTGSLGFPTSDEISVPAAPAPARANTFQKGSLLWYGTAGSIVVASPFKVRVGRIDSKESEGWLQGQNDLYCHITLKDGGAPLYDRRQPSSGSWGGQNVHEANVEIPHVITPNDPAKRLSLVVDVWDADSLFGGGDDHLGTWTKDLNMANGWGFRENNGVLNSGSFAKINSITASVKPDVDPATLTVAQKWWGAKNRGTDPLTYAQYASAFRDVDSDPEWWDVTDWLEKAFYELVVSGLAKNGNCFGMCLEAIYAGKNASIFGLPLDGFDNSDWEAIRNEFNIKHQYQVGASSIWWFLGEVVTGNTHDPEDVFRRTRDHFAGGSDPVLCLAQNWDFSGKPHVVLPVLWSDTMKPWTILVIDPNFPGQLRPLSIDPDNNTFTYDGGTNAVYTGGEWSGGRLYFLPFSLLNEQPRTPIWDAILLILAGTIIILGDDAQTDRITDLNGKDLDAFGGRATTQLKSGRGIEDFFVGFTGYDARASRRAPADGRTARRPRPKGTIAGELLVRLDRSEREPDRRIDASDAAHVTVDQLAADRRLRPLVDELVRRRASRRALGVRPIRRLLGDPDAVRMLSRATREGLERLVEASGPRDFVHHVSGLRRGDLRYVLKHGLAELELQSTLKTGELAKVRASAIGTSVSEVRLASERDKRVTVVLKNKLGVGRDHVSITIDQLPVPASGELRLNPKPGLAGLDLVGHVASGAATVSIEGRVDGRKFTRHFDVPLENGISLKPSTAIIHNELGVATIPHLFGPATDGRLIKGA